MDATKFKLLGTQIKVTSSMLLSLEAIRTLWPELGEACTSLAFHDF